MEWKEIGETYDLIHFSSGIMLWMDYREKAWFAGRHYLDNCSIIQELFEIGGKRWSIREKRKTDTVVKFWSTRCLFLIFSI